MHDFELIPDLIEKKGLEYAESKSFYEYLDEMKKTHLATIMNEKEGSEASREREARTDDRYTKHLQAMKIARKAMLTHEAEYKALNVEFDMQRTVSANSRNQRF